MPFSAQHLKAARLHLMKSEPTMKEIVRRVGPCTLKTRNDRFQMLVNSIVSQQISGAAARTILGRLLEAVEPQKVCPEVLLNYSVDELREIGISRQKAGYVIDLSEKVHGGQINLKAIARKGDDDVIRELIQVKGIGRWTAQMFLMFSLGRLDVFPVDDLGIQNAIKKAYQPRGRFDRKRMEKYALPWRPYTTIASWYLWRSLELD